MWWVARRVTHLGNPGGWRTVLPTTGNPWFTRSRALCERLVQKW
jgi:hypothetical protein